MTNFIYYYNQFAYYWLAFCLSAGGLSLTIVAFMWGYKDGKKETKPFRGIKESSL